MGLPDCLIWARSANSQVKCCFDSDSAGSSSTDGHLSAQPLSLFFRDPDRMECEVLVTNPEAGQVPIGSASHLYA